MLIATSSPTKWLFISGKIFSYNFSISKVEGLGVYTTRRICNLEMNFFDVIAVTALLTV